MTARHGITATALLFVATGLAFGQTSPDQRPLPPFYRGVETRIPGIYVTPVAGAPFTAKVEIVSTERLPDGSVHTVKTTNHIGRQGSGRIYNERRQLVPTSFLGEPRLLSAHIYDPNTRLNIFLNPMTHIAQEIIQKRPPVAPANSVPQGIPQNNPGFQQVELGEQALDGVTLRGIKRLRTIPAARSGTGKEVVVVDEYWYSPDLSVYMIIKHDDPRTGEQIVAVTEVQRGEPNATQFDVPANYKRVDETPLDQ